MDIKELNPNQSWNLLANKKSALLVDVRTNQEFNQVGIVDLNAIGKEPILLPIRELPEMELDANFSQKLVDLINQNWREIANEEIDLLFLCRSGVRSLQAAQLMSELGYNCYNISNGFEGKKDQNLINDFKGWKACNLPWRSK